MFKDINFNIIYYLGNIITNYLSQFIASEILQA